MNPGTHAEALLRNKRIVRGGDGSGYPLDPAAVALPPESRPEILLQAENLLVRRGGATVLDIPAFDVHPGELLALIGPNGAGKSTLLLTLACLLKPSRGRFSFNGREIDAGRGDVEYRRRIAMVFQEPLLFDATVFDNVAAGLKIRGMGREEIGRVVPGYLELFGIAHLTKRSARKLSGGEAQRTSLARAFVTKPEIVFLDEPFSALDPPTREALIGDLERIIRETHTTAVASTHDQTEALRLADRMAVMNGGKIVQIGPVAEVINRPADGFVASFVGVETVLPGRVLRSSDGVFTAAVEGGEIQAVGHLRPGERVLCCIRPEHVTLSTNIPPPGTSARNAFPGTIRKITPLGLFNRVLLNCGFDLVAYVTRQSLETLSLEEGKRVIASFKATAVHVIPRQEPRQT
ncbi:MAG: ABC transporter ATP-binding protein [Syntrophobacterales bacterium CG03_land_8_20_14_0_80_58_14]|nr:MAG: ABC transporter ATP-binding protein [Syntrophobacterales bacterium CG03_land_8_20_14_0_80_58_14]